VCAPPLVLARASARPLAVGQGAGASLAGCLDPLRCFRLVDLLRSLTEQLAVLQRGEKAKALNADVTRRALARAPRESAVVHFALWTGLALVLAGAVLRSAGVTCWKLRRWATLGVISAAGVARCAFCFLTAS